MAEYQLYCFAQSGNSYRAALMLKLIGADWQPVFVDFFRGGVQRSADYRTDINEMGEAPTPGFSARAADTDNARKTPNKTAPADRVHLPGMAFGRTFIVKTFIMACLPRHGSPN